MWILFVVALATRLSVPWVTYNWYFGIGNLPLAWEIFTKATTYLPLPNRLITFDLGLGFHGLVTLNVVVGSITIVLLYRLAVLAGYGRRVAAIFAFLLALIPMYVRLSASDTSQITMFFLWTLSATAFSAVYRRSDDRLDQALLFAATLLGGPIRIEGMAMMAAVPFFVGRNLSGWREIIVGWRRFIPYASALLIGLVVAVEYHGTSAGFYARTIVMAMILGLPTLLMRLAGLINLSVVSYLPVLIAVPILYAAVGWLRRRDWRRLVDAFGPAALLSIPYVVSLDVFTTDLSSSSYIIVYAVFPLIVCAQGIDQMIEDPRLRRLTAARTVQAIAWVVALVLVWIFVIVPYRWTYVFQEEQAFLRRSLPNGSATILTLWDGRTVSGDWDCALAQPYPPFLASHPHLQWVVLDDSDGSREKIRDLRFDYYYPGALVALDPERPTPGSLPALFPNLVDEDRMEADRTRLRRLRELDRAIRTQYGLTAVARVRAPVRWDPPHANGCTGVGFGVPSPELDLVLFRSVE